MSTDIVIAHESVVEQLTEKMVNFLSEWPTTSAVSEVGVAKPESLVRDAIDQGAVIANPAPASQNGLRISAAQLRPVILTEVTPNMRIYHEESFGPVVSILPFKKEDEAVALANQSIYGLSASIFTRNIPYALKLARKIESGAVHINSMSIHDEQQFPHGGMKASGWGRFGVPWGKCKQCRPLLMSKRR